MTSRSKLSALAYALLGLLKMQPASGYALRKIFASTPMAHYSSSPGAIYPALARLEQQGYLRAVADQSGSRRPKQIFHVTAKGWRALQEWLRQPVTSEELIWRGDVLMLRFSYLDLLDDAEVSQQFLVDLRAGVEAQVNGVQQFLKTMGDNMPLHGRLALEQGLAGYRANLRWASRALDQIRSAKAAQGVS